MDILKNKENKLKLDLYKNIIKNDIFIESKCIINTGKVSLLETNSQSSFISVKNFKENEFVFLSKYKKFNDTELIDSNISKSIYKLYVKHFFNFKKKNKIKIVKGRVLKYNRRKNIFYVGVNGLIICVPAKEFTLNSALRKKMLKNGKKLFKLKPISFICTNIEKKTDTFKVKVSRHKYLKSFF